jgi:lipopolysaccharide transport system permease protein
MGKIGVTVSTGWQRTFAHAWPLYKYVLLRDLRSRYRQTRLGIIWIALQPLGYLLVFIVLKSILRTPTQGAPVAVFLICGLGPWLLFMWSINYSSQALAANVAIMRKISLPRMVFPLTGATQALFDSLFVVVFTALLVLWYQIPLTAEWLWLLPIFVLTAALGLAIGMLIGIVGTFVRDVLIGLPYVLQVGMLVSPVIYGLDQVPSDIHPWYIINPLVGLIEGTRAVVIHAQAPDPWLLGISAIWTALLLAIAAPVYSTFSRHVADHY